MQPSFIKIRYLSTVDMMATSGLKICTAWIPKNGPGICRRSAERHQVPGHVTHFQWCETKYFALVDFQEVSVSMT